MTAYAMHLVECCPYRCVGKPALVPGAVIYPHLPHLAGKQFWQCPDCHAYVGCHPNTTHPLGRLANADLRLAKQRAHNAFDELWKMPHYRIAILGLEPGAKRYHSRTTAYIWLAKRLGLLYSDCHIGMFDEEMCKRVVKICIVAKGNYERLRT